MIILHNANNLDILKTLPDNSIDSIVTDPPYGISFMGKKWDYDVPSVETWKELMRVLKPGGHIIVACGTRTQHRMAVNIEDAGFEIRDIVAYIYGSGFPKSLNIYKSLKKRCECGNMEAYENGNIQGLPNKQETEHNLQFVQKSDLPQTINYQEEQGKILQSGLSEQSIPTESMQFPNKVRKGQSSLEGRGNLQESKRELQGRNLSEMSERILTNGKERWIHNATQVSNGATFEQNIEENRGSASYRPQSEQQQDREPCAFCKQWGTQAIRTLGIGTALKPAMELWTLARKPLSEKTVAENVLKWGTGGINIDECRVGNEELVNRPAGNKPGGNSLNMSVTGMPKNAQETTANGRFPANVIHDGSDEVTDLFPNSKSTAQPRNNKNKGKNYNCFNEYNDYVSLGYDDSGSASRFFYCAKASKSERNAGLDGFEKKEWIENAPVPNRNIRPNEPNQNHHPTVKPVALMRYLVKLITPTGGMVLDPFMGSGSTGVACQKENFNFTGIELDSEYFKIAEARINNSV